MNEQNPQVSKQIAKQIVNISHQLNRIILFLSSRNFCHYETPQ